MHHCVIIYKSTGFSVKRRKGTAQTFLDAEKLLVLITVRQWNAEYHSFIPSIWQKGQIGVAFLSVPLEE